MNPKEKSDNQWKQKSFLSRHWDAALFGVAAVTCVATDVLGFDLWVKSALLSSGCFALAAEQYVFQKTRHTLIKSVFIAAMAGSVATHAYQSLPIQKQIIDNAPSVIAPPTRG